MSLLGMSVLVEQEPKTYKTVHAVAVPGLAIATEHGSAGMQSEEVHLKAAFRRYRHPLCCTLYLCLVKQHRQVHQRSIPCSLLLLCRRQLLITKR